MMVCDKGSQLYLGPLIESSGILEASMENGFREAMTIIFLMITSGNH